MKVPFLVSFKVKVATPLELVVALYVLPLTFRVTFLFLGSDLISNVMDAISQSLTILVLIILMVIVVASLFLLGEIIAEYFKNRKSKSVDIYDLISKISAATSIDNLKQIITASNVPESQKRILTRISDTQNMKKPSREAAARRLVEME